MTQTLAEIDLQSGEVRILVGGERPFDADHLGVARVMTLAPGAYLQGVDGTAELGWTASMRVPSRDIDDDRLYAVSVESFVRPSPVLVLSADQPLPPTVIAAVAARWARALSEEGGVRDIAIALKNVALSVLWRRIFLIEQSVRDALADEEISASDYRALRDYPGRLAIVERLAMAVRTPEPSWSPAPGSVRPLVPDVDFFFKHVSDVEDDAKAAVTRLSGLLSSQQVVLTQRQRLEVERFQRVVTLVGAAVLVPGLVAAVFGANVGFHGRDRAGAFWAMLLFMAAGGMGSYALLRSIELGMWADLAAWLRLDAFHHRRWPLTLGAAAAFLAGVGLLILLHA